MARDIVFGDQERGGRDSARSVKIVRQLCRPVREERRNDTFAISTSNFTHARDSKCGRFVVRVAVRSSVNVHEQVVGIFVDPFRMLMNVLGETSRCSGVRSTTSNGHRLAVRGRTASS